MRLIIITADKLLAGEGDAINLLFENGMETLHIRKPKVMAEGIEALLNDIDEKFHPCIVLHDHYELTNRYNLKGIHLNSRNPVAPTQFGFDDSRTISRSCHTIKEVTDVIGADNSDVIGTVASDAIGAADSDAIVDSDAIGTADSRSVALSYVFLSPVFDSISKVGYRQGFTSEELLSYRMQGFINKRVIALGGIYAGNISEIRRYGFGGVAVLGALWEGYIKDRDREKLLERFRLLQDKCTEITAR
ncbi:MAG: thiamine phosphate synthase [Tannerella sp.]|jgi:thiamine-phosphate pyrophosphorylase|nr:thiamine phosphate synthase [Tannerella sp.]